MTTRSIFLFFAVALLVFKPSEACSCLPPNIKRTYFDPTVINYVRAFVRAKQVLPTVIKYKLIIQKNYKGCQPNNIVVVSTRPSSAACGVTLNVGESYVLPIRGGNSAIFLCDFIARFSDLTKYQLHFLNTRNVCCKGSCRCANGKPPVKCFKRPCAPPTTRPCHEAAICRDNYCGGCFDEWFTRRGSPACL